MKSDLIYSVSMPAALVEGRKYPVIFAMHGRGGNETDIVSLLQALKEDFILIGIRGALPLNAGFEYFTIKSIGNPDEQSFGMVLECLKDFIHEVSASYPIDPARQFLFGFSQGAILSMSLALNMGNQIRGFAALNGYIPKLFKENYEEKSVRDTAVYIAHGERDQIFPVRIGQENYEYFKERADDLTYKVYATGHSITPEEKSDVIEWFRRHAH